MSLTRWTALLCLSALSCAHAPATASPMAESPPPAETPAAPPETTLVAAFKGKRVRLAVTGDATAKYWVPIVREAVSQHLKDGGAVLIPDAADTAEVLLEQVNQRYIASTPSICVAIGVRLLREQLAFLPGNQRVERCEPVAGLRGAGPAPVVEGAAAALEALVTSAERARPPAPDEAEARAFRLALSDALTQLNRRARSYQWEAETASPSAR